MSKMQELIKKYQQSDKDEKVLTEIIREIQTCEMLWMAFSPITKNFFVDLVQGSPTVFLFSEKEYCEAYCKHMKSKSNNTLGIVECPKKARLSIFSEFFRSGFESILIDNGKPFLFIDLDKVANIPDYSKLPEKDRPVFNPDFVCSADRFFQCLENKTVTPDKELNLLLELHNAKLLLPVLGTPENNTVTIPGLERKDGSKKVVPFFTDITELRKYDPKGKYNIITSDFEQIEKFCDMGETVVINPFTLNFNVVKQTCEAVRKAVEAVPDHNKTEKAVIYIPDNIDPKLVAVFNQALDNTVGAEKGYLRAVRRNGKRHLMVVVDCGDASLEESKRITEEVEKKAKAYITGDGKIEFISTATDIGKIAEKGGAPFFESINIDFDENDDDEPGID